MTGPETPLLIIAAICGIGALLAVRADRAERRDVRRRLEDEPAWGDLAEERMRAEAIAAWKAGVKR